MRRSLWRKVLLLYKDDVSNLSQSYRLSDFSNLWIYQVLRLGRNWLFYNKNIYDFKTLILSLVIL